MTQGGPIQSVSPSRVERPSTLEAYAQAVRRCVEAGEKIVDYGVTHGSLGHAPPPGHVQIIPPTDTFEHWVSDLSARIPGGMTIGETQRRLGEAGQFLPIDADDDMTIAEVIAHNVSGPLRLTYGHCRDLLLGLRYIDATGTLITVGGRTFKNVAGYDVTRMMVGSLNTLGLIADANLRTAAIPEQVTRSRVTGLDPVSLDPLMTDLLTSDAAPCYIESRVDHGVVAYAGSARGCEAQHAAWVAWLKSHAVRFVNMTRNDVDFVNDADERASARGWRRDAAAHVQIMVPPSKTGAVCNALAAMTPKPAHLDGLPAHGVIHVGGGWTVDEACGVDAHISRIIELHGGLRQWIRKPQDTPRIKPFAPPQADWAMLHRIKQAMDPRGLFNPGRFP